MSEIELTPKNKRTKLRRSYAIADIAVSASDAGNEYEPQVPNDEYEPSQPESQVHATDELEDFDNDPTPKKKQKTVKVPVREAINANRKEQELPKAEKKVSPLIGQV